MFVYSELLRLTVRQYDAHLRSLMEYSEVKNVNDTAFEDVMIKGEIKRTLEIAKSLKAKNISMDIIMETTGLSQQEIESL